jgi:hypothetical protein
MNKLVAMAFILATHRLDAGTLRSTEVVVAEDRVQLYVSGGNSSGIGGDTIDQRYLSAWFYGIKEIKTCFSATSNFGVSEIELVTEIKAAIVRWQTYFDQKKIEPTAGPEMINSNFVFTGKCVDEEDLRLYFGTGPIFGNLSDLKVAQTLGSPVAYINKTHVADGMQWSRGYIRFVSQAYYAPDPAPFPNWALKGALATMITHEMGHVLGFTHVPYTVMESEIAEKIFFGQKGVEPLPLEIDSPRELVTCEACAFNFVLTDPDKVSPEAVKALDLILANGISLVGNRENGILLKNGSKTFPVTLEQTSTIGSTPALISNFKDRPIYRQITSVNYGTIQDSTGVKFGLVFERNGGSAGSADLISLKIVLQDSFRSVGGFGGAKK